MRMVIPLSCVLLLWMYSPAPHQSKVSQQQPVTQEAKPAESSPGISRDSDVHAKASDTKKEDSDPETSGRLYTAYLVSGPIVVALSLGTFVLVWRQIRAIHNSERSWVMVDVEWTPLYQGVTIQERTGIDEKAPGTYTVVSLRIKYANEGKTPAWVSY